MFDNMSPQKRMVLAVVASLLFFVIYSVTFAPKPPVASTSTNTQTAQSQAQKAQSAPSVATPQVNKALTAPTSKPLPDETLVTIHAKDFDMKIDRLGRISSKIMTAKQYQIEGKLVELVDRSKLPLPLEMRFSDAKINDEAFKVSYTANISEANLTQQHTVNVVLTQKLSAVTITKTLNFYEDGHYDINLDVSKKIPYFVATGVRPDVNGAAMTVHGALVETGKDILTIVEDDEVEETTSYTQVRLVSSFDRYYQTMLYSKKAELDVVISPSIDGKNNPTAFVKSDKSMVFSGFIGPKEYKRLKAIDPMLVDSLEYGWFTFIAAPMFWLLQFIHGFVGNWGWAIVFVTLITRIVLYPLSYKGMVSMHKLKLVAPKIKEIQKKHKGDPQKLNAAMMALYKKEGANPMGGCLPLLLQIPIFFAIYRVLLNSIELQGAPWMLWIDDLAQMDPYYILPIIMGATMYYQQRITPTNFTDPMQEKIFKYLPIIFTLFFFTFPAGLVLYWVVNNTLTIAQQYLVNKKFKSLELARDSKAE